jgi:hypothetical protein
MARRQCPSSSSTRPSSTWPSMTAAIDDIGAQHTLK